MSKNDLTVVVDFIELCSYIILKVSNNVQTLKNIYYSMND